MKHLRILSTMIIQAILVLVSAFTAQRVSAATPIPSGIYSYEDIGETGKISIAFNNKGELWFQAFVINEDGHSAELTPEEGKWIPIKGNKFSYNVKTDFYDYTLEGEFFPDEELLELKDNFKTGTPFGIGMGLAAHYRYEGGSFADKNGYIYHLVDEGENAVLAAGGRYSGIVEVPESVKFNGEDYPVVGIADRAFTGNYDVTEIRMSSKDMYIVPGAFWGSGIPYDWDSLEKPGYVYPDKDLFEFVSPTSKGEEYDYEMDNWLIFKQNCDRLFFIRDNSDDEDAPWGCYLSDPEKARGIHYELRTLDVLRKKMFRGYDNYEVIALASDSQFAAFHQFPSFSRWKYPEPEVPLDLVYEQEIAEKFGRKIMYSRRVAELRESNRCFGMVEFEHKGGEAMVAFVWIDYGTITATYSKKAEFNPEDPYSIWNVDLEEYGTPEVISIALDPQDNPIIWFNHPAPESRNIMGLRKVGDKLVPFGEDQWYVAVD